MKIAAIDMGSNAIRLAIGVVQKNGHIRPLKTYRAPVRLGKDVFSEKASISRETALKVEDAFLQFKKHLKREKVAHVRAVATSAVRDASNSRDFVRWLESRTGIHICVIDGEQEGNLIHQAIVDFYDLRKKSMLVFDIGGGSVELTGSVGGRLRATKSLPFGTVRLLNASKTKKGTYDPARMVRAIQKAQRAFSTVARQVLGRKTPDVLVGTGGNIEALGKLRKKILHAKSERVLGAGELDILALSLRALTYRERIEKLELRPDRADVIVPAVYLLRSVVKITGSPHVFVPGCGLKDGVLVDMAQTLLTQGSGKKSKKISKKSSKKSSKKQAGIFHSAPALCTCFPEFD